MACGMDAGCTPHSVAKVRAAMMQDLQPVTGSDQRRLTRFFCNRPSPWAPLLWEGLSNWHIFGKRQFYQEPLVRGRPVIQIRFIAERFMAR